MPGTEERQENLTDVEISNGSTDILAPPPDGGMRAWSQQLYTGMLSKSPSDISWIGGMQTFLLMTVGVISGRATDAGYFPLVFRTGALLQVFGVFMLSLCKTYWQVFLAQALTLGLGNGLVFSSALVVTSSYFERHRALAVGIGVAGGATGGLIYPTIVDRMLDYENIGFGWTVRSMGLVMLVTNVVAVLLYKPRLPPRTAGPLFEMQAFTEFPFVMFTVSFFFVFWGIYFPFFYISTYGRDQLGIDDTLGVILVLNGAGVVGRIGAGLIGDRWTGRLNILIIFIFAAGIMAYCWIAVIDKAGFYVFTTMYGILGGAAQSLFPAASTTMTPDIKRTGTRVGMIFGIAGIASLTGPSIEGALIQNNNGDYEYAQIFAGTVICAGGLACLAARVAKTGWVVWVKA